MSDQPKKPGWRDSLNLPATAFPMKADLTAREPRQIAEWNEKSRYAELRRRRAGRPVWLLHDGPPYSNNHLHMGTAANKIWKDAAVRQATLSGFDSPYVPIFLCGWGSALILAGVALAVTVGPGAGLVAVAVGLFTLLSGISFIYTTRRGKLAVWTELLAALAFAGDGSASCARRVTR